MSTRTWLLIDAVIMHAEEGENPSHVGMSVNAPERIEELSHN